VRNKDKSQKFRMTVFFSSYSPVIVLLALMLKNVIVIYNFETRRLMLVLMK